MNQLINCLNLEVTFLHGDCGFEESLAEAIAIQDPLSRLIHHQYTFDDFLDEVELIVPNMDEYLDQVEHRFSLINAVKS